MTSPQAFEALRAAGRPVRRPDLTVATMDHNVPTTDGPDHRPAREAAARRAAARTATSSACRLFATGSGREGIVHVIGPELGLTQPGMTIVCGDSHTSTHGAFGALAFGIGTSEVEHVLATQTLPQSKPKTMQVDFDGRAAVRRHREGHGAGRDRPHRRRRRAGHVIEYTGEAIRALSMEGRMTVCNMSIEAGARAGMIAPDETTFAYSRGPRPAFVGERTGATSTPTTAPSTTRCRRSTSRSSRRRSRGARTPGMVAPIDGVVPDPAAYDDADAREAVERALRYMDLKPGTTADATFASTGSSSARARTRGSRISRAAARVVDGRRVADGVHAIVVPGSAQVKRQAEEEGLREVFERPASSGAARGARCASA